MGNCKLLEQSERGMSKMFMGTYQHSLDAKNRLIIPAKFRNQLGDNFVIIQWTDNSLHAFTMAGWQAFSDKLNSLPTSDARANKMRRVIFGSALEAEFDKQGRISLPAKMVAFAGIDKEVAVVGTGEDSFELWAADKWDAYNDEGLEAFDDIASGLMDLGF